MGRPTSSFLPEDLDQPPLEQRLHHRARVHAAHVLDLRPGHRLPVGDDGQRLQRGAGEPLRLHPQEPAHELAALRIGPQLPAAGHLGEHDAAHALAVDARTSCSSACLEPRPLDAGGLVELVHGQRLVGDEEERLDHGRAPARATAAARLDQLLERARTPPAARRSPPASTSSSSASAGGRGHRAHLGLAERHRRPGRCRRLARLLRVLTLVDLRGPALRSAPASADTQMSSLPRPGRRGPAAACTISSRARKVTITAAPRSLPLEQLEEAARARRAAAAR